MKTNILEIIRDLLSTRGPQSFSQILHGVRTQCQDVFGLEEAHRQVKAHIAYLVSLQLVIEQSDEFGVVYGHSQEITESR